MKRMLKLVPAVIAVSLVLCCVAGVFLRSFVNEYLNDENKKRFRVGVIGDTEDSFLNFGIEAIMSFDSSRFSIEFEKMTVEAAEEELQNKTLTAYVIIPDGFIDEISHGNVLSLKYVSSPYSAGVTNIFKEEVLSAVSQMMEASQDGVFGLQFALEDAGVNSHKKIVGYMDELCAKYIAVILNRSLVCTVEETGISDGISFPGYFLCGLSLMFLMLWGMSTSSVYAVKNSALSKNLYAKGRKGMSQILCEYVSYLLIMMLTLAVIIAAIAVFAGKYAGYIPELAELVKADYIRMAVLLIPVLLTLSSLQFMLYEMTDGIVSGVLTQFIVSLGLSYVSGLFYPVKFFPDSIQSVSHYLPTGAAREYAESVLTGNADSNALMITAAFFVLFMTVSVIIRKRRIAGRFGDGI